MTEEQKDLERRMKALNSLRASAKEMVDRYGLLYRNASDQIAEIEKQLQELEDWKNERD